MERFFTVRPLGEGGAARVLLVEDRARGRARVALKELLDPTPEHAAALRREFALLSGLKHPGLVEVLEFEVEAQSGRPRFTMEFIDGTDVVATVAAEGPASFGPLVAETLRALGFLHDFGLLHRDLKPGNLLVRRAAKSEHRAVLLDFGLAAERHTEAPTLAMAGTLPYIAPELFEGGAPSKRTDLYALGVVLHEAVHGRTPYALKGSDLTGFVAAVRSGRRSRPAVPEGFPAGLARWLDGMLSPDPAERPATAADALARFNEACGETFALETEDDRSARLGSGQPAGRDAELAALRAVIEPGPIPRVVLLAGDSGSGKTRILRFLAGEAIGRGWRVHRGPGALGETADAFIERVRRGAAKTPTVVLLDELESADSLYATVLDRIAREPGQPAVRVVGALRASEVTEPRIRKLLGDVGVVPSLTRIDLAPLDEAGLSAMIERASAGRSSAKARVPWLLETSEGNAGFAEALLVEGTWERKARVPVATALERSITSRIATLSPEAHAWLEALVVLDGEAEETLVAELSGLEELAQPTADAVIAVGLARRSGAFVAPDSRRVADAVRRSIPETRSRELHALAATHYATTERDLFGAIAWRLARLWRGAGELDRALATALDAARAAATHKDHADAAERYAFALRCLPRRDPRRSELWTERGESLRHATIHAASVKAFGWAACHARDETTRLEARARHARALLMVGRYDAAAARAVEIRELARVQGSKLAEAMALYVSSVCESNRFGFEKSIERARQGLEVLPDDQPELRVRLLQMWNTGERRVGLSPTDREIECAHLCDEHGFYYLTIMGLLSQSIVFDTQGDLASAAARIEEADKVSTAHGVLTARARVVHQKARVARWQGRLDSAHRLFRASAELCLYEGDAQRSMLGIEGAAEALSRLGHVAEAAEYLKHELSVSRAPASSLYRAAALITLAHVLMHESSADEATIEALIEEAASRYDPSAPSGYSDLLLCRLSHRTRPSSGLPVEPVIAEYDDLVLRFGIGRVPAMARGQFATKRGRWLVSARRFLEAQQCALEAVSVLQGFDPGLCAEAYFLLADTLDGIGRLEEARKARLTGRDLIDQAATLIEDLDMRRDFLEQPPIRDLLATIPQAADTKRLEALYEMIRALNSEENPEALLESILEMATRASGAERGMILLTGPTGTDFSVRLVKNLEKETEADAEGFSRRIMAEAGAGKSVLAIDAGDDDRYRDLKSVSLFRIRSLMCVPLRSRGSIIGTVYLDNRKEGRPFTRDDLRFVEAFADHAAIALANARRRADLEAENKRLRAVVGERSSYGQIVGRSAAMQRVFDLLEKIAPTDATVLIQGESGTGKELVAQALHALGPRKDKAFLSENCAAMPETLLESELFGHVRGAFTGADRDRTGLFEQAHQGTLFLDEIGDTSPGMQARLLRVVQEGVLRRVGDERPIKVDVRVIAATNKNLQAEVAAGRFREDLYYRLAVVPVSLPPLRERIGDVPVLVQHLMERLSQSRGRKATRIESEVVDALERYPWPGNVRQLENLLRRLALLAGDAAITVATVESDPDLARALLGKPEAFSPVMSLVRNEEEQIRRALEASAGNRDRAARLLGISRATIYRKMKEYQLR